MKVLVVGGAGMLGHKAFERLRKWFDACVTFREPGVVRKPGREERD